MNDSNSSAAAEELARGRPRLTLAVLAAARGLDASLLRRLGWREAPGGVAIPWPLEGGGAAWHVRLALEKPLPGSSGRRWVWRNHDRATLLPFGADRLTQLREQSPGAAAVVLCESEVDAVALWTAGLAALAVGGADGWLARWWPLLTGFARVVVWLEDDGTLPLLRAVAASRPAAAPPLAVCHALGLGGPGTEGAEKDAGRLLARRNGRGAALLRAIVEAARPITLVPAGPAGPDLLGEVTRRLGARRGLGQGGETYSACCPLHDDEHASLSLFRGARGAWRFKCHAGGCGATGSLELLAAAGLGLVAAAAPAAARSNSNSICALYKDSAHESNSSSHSVRALPFQPLARVLAAAPPAPAWTWGGFAAPGVLTGLVGTPKTGKTTLVFALLSAQASGAPFAGAPTRRVRTLLLTEERAATLREKAARWGLGGGGGEGEDEDGSNLHVLLRSQALGVPWPDVVEQAVQHALKIGIEQLVVDTFPAWAGLPGELENAAGAVLEAIAPLQTAAAAGLAVIVVLHGRKSGGEFGENIRGSSALAGALDVIVSLERAGADVPDGGGARARVLRAVSRFEDTPGEIVLELTDEGYEARGDLGSVRLTSEREAVRAALAASTGAASGATVEELAASTGLARRRLFRRLDELLATGQVERRGNGRKGDPFRWRLAVPAAGVPAPPIRFVHAVSLGAHESNLAAARTPTPAAAAAATTTAASPPAASGGRSYQVGGRCGRFCP